MAIYNSTVQNAVKMIRLHEMALHFDASLFLKRVLFKLQVGCNLWWSVHLDHKMFESILKVLNRRNELLETCRHQKKHLLVTSQKETP